MDTRPESNSASTSLALLRTVEAAASTGSKEIGLSEGLLERLAERAEEVLLTAKQQRDVETFSTWVLLLPLLRNAPLISRCFQEFVVQQRRGLNQASKEVLATTAASCHPKEVEVWVAGQGRTAIGREEAGILAALSVVGSEVGHQELGHQVMLRVFIVFLIACHSLFRSYSQIEIATCLSLCVCIQCLEFLSF